MVNVGHNKGWWETYDWAEAGDEWSQPWGSPSAQWYGSLLPRVHHFLPASNVVEIACGYGRWTEFLKDQCESLTGFDLAENCVEACRERFAADDHVSFVANDGASLPGIADASVDLVFSFDSLVHVDRTTIAAYLGELRRVLKPEGVAFIHHSNLGAYAGLNEQLRRVPKLPGALRRLGVVEYQHMRDESVMASFVEDAAKRAGLRCIGQEILPWLTRRTEIDCISLIVPEEHPLKRPNQVVHNPDFTREPAYVARIESVYGPHAGRDKR